MEKVGGNKIYTEKDLIASLHRIESKYKCEPNSSIVDKDKGTPSRQVYKRVFGSFDKALVAAGYLSKKKKIFTKETAQAELDKRNGHFEILKFTNCREKSLVRCKKCGFEWNVATYSLYDNKTSSNGCPNCHKELGNIQLNKNMLEIIKYEEDGKIKLKCQKCGATFITCPSNARRENFNCQLCSRVDLNHYKLIKLLDGSLQSYYIIGFLLADGSFKNSRIVLRLQKSDKEIINKMVNYLHIKELATYEKNSYGFSCADNYTSKEMRNKYKISNRKTYIPCDISSLCGDNFISFLIGFIDGDGSIGYRSDSKALRITIKLHHSWYDNLLFISKTVYEFFGITKYPRPTIVTITENKKYASLTLGNRDVIQGLKKFIENNNLFVLTRKWDKIC